MGRARRGRRQRATRPPTIVEARPEAQPADGRPRALRVLRRPHAGKGAAVRAGMLAATGDLVIFADADLATPPDQLPLLTEALATTTSRWAAASSPTAATGAPASRSTGACWASVFHAAGRRLGDRAGARHAVRLQGLPARRRRATCSRASASTSIVFDAEIIHLARRRGLPHGHRAGPVDGQARLAHARAPGLALRVLCDLVRIPLIHRGVGRARRSPTTPAMVDGAMPPDGSALVHARRVSARYARSPTANTPLPSDHDRPRSTHR